MMIQSILLTVIVTLIPFARQNDLAAGQLPLLTAIMLPGVSGRIDHMAFDAKGNRLFIAAVANNTVEVVDMKSGKRIRTINNLSTPQNVLYIEECGCIVVSNGGDGTVRFFRDDPFLCYRTIDLGDDADNMRYDAVEKQILVGYGNGAIAVIDASAGSLISTLSLPGHPEAFELEPGGKRIFVNVPASGQVVVLDREKKIMVAEWTLTGINPNFPMALDDENRRLFIGCRSPARLVVLNSDTGREVASLDCIGDADDIFYDAVNKRIYLSGGSGGIDVFGQTDADHYVHLSRTITARGARTSILVPERKVLYVAVPRLLMRTAQVRAYGIEYKGGVGVPFNQHLPAPGKNQITYLSFAPKD